MRLLTELIDLVLPGACVCCERPGAIWCAGCQPASAPKPVDAGQRLPDFGRESTAALIGSAAGPPTFAAGEYAEQLRSALIAYKERGRRQLVNQLAGYLADAVDCAARAAGSPRPVLVPVPSSRSAARARGGDHMVRLARAAARQTGLPVLTVLALTGAGSDSAGLSAAQRRRNLAGRMSATSPPGIAGQPILVDDIVTTGATLAEAGRALAAAGWQPAGAAVVAATRLRRPPERSIAGDRTARAPPSGAVTIQ
jgi:predicted amidophosphoribosyltransferase